MHRQNKPFQNYQQPYQGSSNPTIKNPSSQFEKGPVFSDRDRLNDLLATEKWLTDGYNVFLRETSHESLFNEVLNILNETHHAARDIFNLMFEKGWYSLQAEQTKKIEQQHQKFAGYENQFSNHGQNYHQSNPMFETRDY